MKTRLRIKISFKYLRVKVLKSSDFQYILNYPPKKGTEPSNPNLLKQKNKNKHTHTKILNECSQPSTFTNSKPSKKHHQNSH